MPRAAPTKHVEALFTDRKIYSGTCRVCGKPYRACKCKIYVSAGNPDDIAGWCFDPQIGKQRAFTLREVAKLEKKWEKEERQRKKERRQNVDDL